MCKICDLETGLKEWYEYVYPYDVLSKSLHKDKTFGDLMDCLDNYEELSTLGIVDSIIRERLFEQLSYVIDMPYDYIYEQWLRA